MRNFIIGLLLGSFAAYLWRNNNRSRGRHSTASPTYVDPPFAPPENERAPAMSMPPTDGAPSYETAPLQSYSAEYQALADQLFWKAASLTREGMARKTDGGYSFQSESGGTIARIIVYQRQHGTEYGAFPMLQDGVYVLLQARPSAPNTLGVAPHNEERFNYRKVNVADLDGAAHEIADMLLADVVLR